MMWRKISGFENYEVSEFGDIRSRLKTQKRKLINSGYLKAHLWNGKMFKYFLVHRIVYESFIGAIPWRMQVNHMDGNKLNNHYSNLNILSAKDNIAHAEKIGLINQWGSRNKMAKLTEQEVLEIRKLKGKMKQIEIAKIFNISDSTVGSIHNRLTWRHLK